MLKKYLQKTFSLFLFIGLACTCAAQKKLKQPLEYVPADSVVMWGEGTENFRAVALGIDKALKEQPVKASRKAFKKKLKAWRREWLPLLSLTGARNEDGKAGVTEDDSRLFDTASGLFLVTGHADFMEAVERTLYNGLAHTVYTGRELNFERHLAAQALVNAAGRIYATDKEGLWVNLYVNNTAHICTPHFSVVVDEITAMPYSGRVKVRLSSLPYNGFRLKLRLRMPYWARGVAFPSEVYSYVNGRATAAQPPYVNGRPVLQMEEKDGYYIIDRAWNNGDEVLLELPVQPRFVTHVNEDAPENMQRVAIQCGPLSYVIEPGAGNGMLPKRVQLAEVPGQMGEPLYAGKYEHGVTFTAVPYMSHDGRLWTMQRKGR